MRCPPFSDEIRDVRGYEGLYGVTRDGRVFSHRTSKWLRFDETQGYLRAPLTLCGRSRFVKVHRLVAVAWVQNPAGKPEINHRDGNKKNNRDTNLEWVTRSENEKHALVIGLKQNSRDWHGRFVTPSE